MLYAADDIISEKPIKGGVEISKEEHDAALAAILSGNRAVVRRGELRILRPIMQTIYGPDGEIELSVDDDIPEGYTEEAPPSHRHEWDGSAWVLSDAAKAEIEAEETRDALAATDAGMARVAEDIIGLLIDKGVFTAEELPESVREKIQAREALRSQINERKR